MNTLYKILFLAFFLLFTEGVTAQARFKATAFAGINLSQIDGDEQDGYRKPGLSLGINGSIFINPAFDISTELMYSTKGAALTGNINADQRNTYFSTFDLKYSEIALLTNFYLKPNSSKTYYTRSIHLGFSYGRLLQSATSIYRGNQLQPLAESNIVSQYNPHDVSVIVGWSQLFTQRLGITLRHTTSLTTLYRYDSTILDANDKPKERVFKYLRPYFLSCHVFYNLVSPNKVMGLKVKKKKVATNPLEELH
jgi:Outer membrane protein beta-barrel domain